MEPDGGGTKKGRRKQTGSIGVSKEEWLEKSRRMSQKPMIEKKENNPASLGDPEIRGEVD